MDHQLHCDSIAPAGVKEQYVPSKQEALSRHEINISFLSRGCIIRVGCKSIPFSSTEEGLNELVKYFNDPVATQKHWESVLR
jgi:hypothetical protein